MRTNHRLAANGSFEARTALLDPLAALLPAGNPRYLQGACSARELERIGAHERVLVLGAARPAIDVVLALDAQAHAGAIRLVSPHALLLTAEQRLAPALAARLTALRAAGKLDVCAGTVGGAAAYGDQFVVDVLPRGRTLHLSERYDWIVNCTTARELGGHPSRAAH